MGKRKVPFKTNVKQPQQQDYRRTVKRAMRQRKKRPRFLHLGRGSIFTFEVDENKEKIDRIKWILKWVAIIPLSIIMLIWAYLIVIDLFHP